MVFSEIETPLIEDIQKWLGHSEISITERVYAHFDADIAESKKKDIIFRLRFGRGLADYFSMRVGVLIRFRK
jgi:hypothetical protein